jgi:hypothetical protein
MKKGFYVIVIALICPLFIEAKTIEVKTIPALQSAINIAKAGDIIILANNKYADAGLIKIDNNGITVKSATPGGVTLTGNSFVVITGNNNTFSGFQFIDVNVSAGKQKKLEKNGGQEGEGRVVAISGKYNVITQCNFYNCISKNYVHFEEGSQYNELTFSNLEAKPATMNAGPGIQITTSDKVVSHTKISHCTFMNFGGEGGDFGNEPIRIGLGIEQNNTSGAIVEYCYFENLGMGDSETISLKSTYNIIRYNTFNNNPVGQLVFRTGNKSAAYGNFFINSGGIRIKEGGKHCVYNNYFQGAAEMPSLELMNFKLNQKTLVGEPLDSIYVYHNTFYNAGKIEMGGKSSKNEGKGKGLGSNPPKNIQFINNLIVKNSGAVVENLNENVTYSNNIFWGDAKLGFESNKTQFININPKMKLNSTGYYVLSEKSPAIDVAISAVIPLTVNPVNDNDVKLMLDIEGQSRLSDKTKNDIGCDEFSTGKITNRPLKQRDVGPSYLFK